MVKGRQIEFIKNMPPEKLLLICWLCAAKLSNKLKESGEEPTVVDFLTGKVVKD